MNPNFIVLKKWHFKFLSERKTMRENFKLGVNSTYIVTLLFIGVLGIYYVWNLNVNATKGYNITNLERDRNQLTIEKEILDVKIAELQSTSSMKNWEGSEIMEKVDTPHYLVVKDMKDYAFNY